MYVVRRQTRSGEARWLVRWQHGRHSQQVHLGSFRTRREAEVRAEWARMKLAAGVAPTLAELDRDLYPTVARRVSVGEAVAAWIASRVDVSDSTRQTYESVARRVVADLGDEDAATVSAERIAQWVREVGVAPRSVPKYLGILAGALDLAGRDPNPARSRVVRIPRAERMAMRLPSRASVEAVRVQLAARYLPAYALLEHLGVRVAEACAVTWGDVADGRVLVRGTKTSSAPRWVSSTLFDPPLVLVRPESARQEQAVSPVGAGSLASAMQRACGRAGVEPFHPHDLRHLWCSRRVWRGDPLPIVASEAGHASMAFTLSTYAHVAVPEDWR